MAYLSIETDSSSLGRQVPLKVIMPQLPKDAPKCKCLYLLHGLSDDCSAWTRRTSIERYASRYSLAVVMPDGGKSFYTNMAYGDNYYDYIAKELPETIEAMFNVSDNAKDRYIGGLSMGGYGALKTALREDGRYSAAISLSPAADIVKCIADNDWFKWEFVFGDEKKVPCEDDVMKLACKCNKRPRIYLAVGTNDFLYENCAGVRKKLDELGYDLHYEEGAGDHNWEFWDLHIEKALKWIFEDEKR